MKATMDGPLQEADWKYLQSIREELLCKLCNEINEEAARIARSKSDNAHQRYLKLFAHLEKSDDIIGDCFNDWRRSRLGERILFLRQRGLLNEDAVAKLSQSAREWLSKVENLKLKN